MKRWFLSIVLSYLSISEVALARCSDSIWNLNYDIAYSLPNSLNLPLVPLGGVLSEQTWSDPRGLFIPCAVGDMIPIVADSTMELSNYPNVYKTNVEGIGIRFQFWHQGNYVTVPTPLAVRGANDYLPGTFDIPSRGKSQLIRIGAGIGKNDLAINVKFIAKPPAAAEIIYSGKKSTTISNSNYMMCSLPDSTLNVPMGKFYVGEIKSNLTTEKLFSFNVKCTGLPASKRPPVKVYFQGDSPGDGFLNLSGVGSGNVASGVKISLMNDKDIKLPFSLANALKLDWQRSEATGEIYGFKGKAKYVPTGGVIKPGIADGVMNIILDYN